MIDKNAIESAYTRVLEDVSTRIPIEKWRIRPTGAGITPHKSKHGEATPKGMINIASSFIGTTAYQKLDQTLRHEFAHLAVGLHHHHNKYFRRVALFFGVDPSLNLESDLEAIEANIDFKYTVIAHLVDGTQVNVGGVHRKTKRYTNYTPTDRQWDSYNHIRVKRYELITNR